MPSTLLGYYASWRPWRPGVVMAMIGVGLLVITIAVAA
jgi:hypothetical protein